MSEQRESAGGMLKRDLEKEVRKSLRPGTYTFYIRRQEIEDGRKKKPFKRKMELVGVYTHHAVFRDTYGFCHAFQYFDLEKYLQGEPIGE